MTNDQEPYASGQMSGIILLKEMKKLYNKHKGTYNIPIQFIMKQKPKSPKLKRYYLKPVIKKKILKGWRFASVGNSFYAESFNEEGRTTKRKFLQWAIDYIKRHGGGSLRIMLRNGKFQEERTYPKGRDPRRSKG